MKIYCQKCGAKIEFSVKSKPKFCHGCGTSMSKGVGSIGTDKSVGAAFAKAQDSQNTENDDDDEIQQVPHISGLEIDIEVQKIKPESIEGLMGTSEGYTKYPSPNTTPLSKEEFRREFQREAGALRPSDNPPKTDEK